MQLAKKTFCQSLILHIKNVGKLCIGLSFLLKLVIFPNLNMTQ